MSVELEYIPYKRIGSGGMAEVMLGVANSKTGFQRLCVMKIPRTELVADQQFLAMLQREANICQSLQHANIVQTLGFERLENSYALIMEYVHGVDLKPMIERTVKAKATISVSMAVYVAAEVAKALAYVHGKINPASGKHLHIVHRDISPSNILVSFEGEVKLTDFGIGKAEMEGEKTRFGLIKGKVSYMSPEQCDGAAVGPQSDIFSLGIVLWEMLMSRRLFDGKSLTRSIELVTNARLPGRMSQLNPEIDAELERIVETCLQRNPSDRYQSAAQLEKELVTYLHRAHPGFTQHKLATYIRALNGEELKRREVMIAEAMQHATDASAKTAAASAAIKHSVSNPQMRVELEHPPTDAIYMKGRDMTLVDGGDSNLPLSALPGPALAKAAQQSPAPLAHRVGATAPVRARAHGSEARQPRHSHKAQPLKADGAVRLWVGAGAFILLLVLAAYGIKALRPSQNHEQNGMPRPVEAGDSAHH